MRPLDALSFEYHSLSENHWLETVSSCINIAQFIGNFAENGFSQWGGDSGLFRVQLAYRVSYVHVMYRFLPFCVVPLVRDSLARLLNVRHDKFTVDCPLVLK